MQDVRRAVVKVGSAVVAPSGVLDEEAVERIACDLAGARRAGVEVVLVSSGAVAAGYRALGLGGMPGTIRDKQAAAAVGQPRLVRAYAARLGRHGLGCAQVLLTSDDFDDRRRLLNARHTLEALLERGIIPIVNENDSVSYEEIRVGDNDRLSALVAWAIGADALLMLSSVSGLEDASGVVPRVSDIGAARALVRTERSGTGTGGFATKLDAAAIAVGHGVRVVVTRGPTGARADPVSRVLAGEAVGTVFDVDASVRAPQARKSWVGYSATVRGVLILDAGAQRAVVERGASLLPGGIVGVEGSFEAGAVVELRGPSGVVGRGQVSYASREIARIRGRRSEEIEGVLGYRYADEVVHRDDMLVTGMRGGAR